MQLTLNELAAIATIAGVFFAIAALLWSEYRFYAWSILALGITLLITLSIWRQTLVKGFIVGALFWIVLLLTWINTKNITLRKKIPFMGIALLVNIALFTIWEIGWFSKDVTIPIWIFLLLVIGIIVVTYFASRSKILYKGISYRFKFQGGDLEGFLKALSSFSKLKNKRWRAVAEKTWNLEVICEMPMPSEKLNELIKLYDAELLCIGYLINLSEDGFI